MAEKKNLFSDKGRIRGPHVRILHWKAARKVKRPSRAFCEFVTNTKYRLPKNIAYWYMEKLQMISKLDKNSSGDEIANLNFYAVHPEAT